MKQQFDLFGTGEAREPEAKAQSPSTHDVRGIADEIEMVRRLEETGRYRVLRKLEPRAIADLPHQFLPERTRYVLSCGLIDLFGQGALLFVHGGKGRDVGFQWDIEVGLVDADVYMAPAPATPRPPIFSTPSRPCAPQRGRFQPFSSVTA